MPFEFPTVPVPSTGPTLTVLDPGQAPTTILDADQPFSLRIEWSVGGAWIATIGGEWLVRAYAESIGPGVERQLGAPGPLVVSLSNYTPGTAFPGQRIFTATIVVPAGQLPAESPPPNEQSGVYNLVTVITHRNFGADTELAGSATGPVVQMRQP
jgi:hypothetical protein